MRLWNLLPVMVGMFVLFTNACSESPENSVVRSVERLDYPHPPASSVTELPSSLEDVSPTNNAEPIISASSGLESSDSLHFLPTATEVTGISQTLPMTATETPTALPAPTPTPCLSPGRIETGYYDSQLAGRINYRLYLPPCYSESGRTYPALYMLPGNIHTDSIWDELGLDEALETGIKEKRFPPMLIVMVSGGSLANNTSGGPGSYESFFMDEFVPYIEGTYCVLPRGRARAIGGMSRGGYWSLEIAFSHPDDFVSVGGHSAALVDFNGGPAINPLDTGLKNDLDDLRIYFDIGENDWLLPNIQKLHEEMSSVGREHSWTLNEGMHEETYWAAHLIDYLEWYSEPWQNPEIVYPPCRIVGVGYSSSD
jgi:enterochelin esterase-like enzyme